MFVCVGDNYCAITSGSIVFMIFYDISRIPVNCPPPSFRHKFWKNKGEGPFFFPVEKKRFFWWKNVKIFFSFSEIREMQLVLMRNPGHKIEILVQKKSFWNLAKTSILYCFKFLVSFMLSSRGSPKNECPVAPINKIMLLLVLLHWHRHQFEYHFFFLNGLSFVE